MLLIRCIDLFTLSSSSNQNQQGGVGLWCGKQPFEVSLQCIDVTMQYFCSKSPQLALAL